MKGEWVNILLYITNKWSSINYYISFFNLILSQTFIDLKIYDESI